MIIKEITHIWRVIMKPNRPRLRDATVWRGVASRASSTTGGGASGW